VADLRRRVSHLGGLIDRYDLDKDGRQGRVLREMTEVLQDLATSVEELTANQFELEDYVSEIDNDLMALEEDLDRQGRGRRGRAVDAATDGGWDGAREVDDAGDEDEEEVEYIELECPVCEKSSYYNGALIEREGIQLTCPHCGNVVFDADEDCLVMEEEEGDRSSL
jgi:endogenous inhibitor of DNA gyrase (YacG/DUF329 family)